MQIWHKMVKMFNFLKGKRQQRGRIGKKEEAGGGYDRLHFTLLFILTEDDLTLRSD